MKTFHYETTFVALVLLAVNYFTHRLFTIEMLAAIAVLLTFGHVSIADRLAEQEELRAVPVVDYYKKLWYYFVGKEFFWFLYFFLNHSYSALVGVFLFLAYPVWRKIYRKKIQKANG
jgi:hypothetical protein